MQESCEEQAHIDLINMKGACSERRRRNEMGKGGKAKEEEEVVYFAKNEMVSICGSKK
jgi:hypothetical protein